MPKRQKKQAAGAPEWMVTFSDMMTLLLCFFVLIVSFSEIKKKDQYQAVVEEIKKAFGMKGGGGKLPTKDDPALTLIERLEAVRLQSHREPNPANVNDPAMQGRESKVTQIRDGNLFVIGGPVTFEPGSADLSNEAKAKLMKIAELMRGWNNIVELRGHAASMELAGLVGHRSKYKDLRDLSFARARAVMDFLTSDPVSLRPDRFRLIANGDREPLIRKRFTSSEQEPNRRVEVFVSEALMQDYAQARDIGL